MRGRASPPHIRIDRVPPPHPSPGQRLAQHLLLLPYQIGTVVPRFNEVPLDCGNLFVISRVRYIENLDLINFGENKQNVRYIEVQLMINFQPPASISVMKICIRSYCLSKNRQTKLLKTTVHINFILVGLFRIHLQLSFGHVLTFIRYIESSRGIFYVCVSGLCSLLGGFR